jgi:amino acid adenylation domain-containing protein
MEKSFAFSPVKRALLEQRLKGSGNGKASIPRRGKRDSAAVSLAQRQIWVIDQVTPGNSAYNLPYGFRVRGPLDLAALEESFNRIIERHQTLRTTFTMEDGEPLQLIHPELKIKIHVTALDHLAPDERERTLQAIASEEAIKPFDLHRLPLIRVSVFKLAHAEYVLILNLHHIVADGLSIALLLNELDVCYRAFTLGQRPHLPDLALQYADFAEWERRTLGNEGANNKQIEFWQKRLSSALPVLELPTDKMRPAFQSFRGSNVFFDIPPVEAQQLADLGRREGATFFMTLLAAFQVLLQRYSGAEDFVIGTPVAARNPREVQPLIGNFLNMAALRCDLSGDPTFVELLRRTRAIVLEAFSNSDLPFDAMMKHLKFERNPSRNPVFQVLLQVLPAMAPRLGNLEISSFYFDLKFAQFDLSLHLYEESGGYHGRFEYCSDLFERETIQRLCAHYGNLLEAVGRDPNQRISTLPMLTRAEHHQLLVEWGNTSPAHLRNDTCLHNLIEEQAARTPDQPAITFEQQTLTYGELNRRANQLGHRLSAMGVVPDALVGVFLDRSLDLVVAMIAILKAGGAYVPIDPAYPRERIRNILEDSKSATVLTQRSLLDALPKFNGSLLCLDAESDTARESDENVVTNVKTEHLAYVLFTSGSTGRPKGVALEHRSAAAFVQWAKEVYTPQELSGVLFATSVCFDLSVFEIFVTLSAGGRIFVARNALDLPNLLQKEQVTLINTVPSAIAELLRTDAIPSSVKTVNLAGEALSSNLVEQLYANTSIEKVNNLYGPTETTTYSTYTLVPRGSPVTIGKPITGTRSYILDASLNPVPIGVVGELYLAGAGVARGYYRRPDLTNERFLPDPIRSEPDARMYRTGDLCRWLPDGNIQYIGRADHQIKLRGFRIELGEIEQVLKNDAELRDAAVVVREVDGDKKLVAYCVPASATRVDSDHVRKILRQRLPEYMIPAHFIEMQSLPLTPNGKLDRKALPGPAETNGSPVRIAVPPKTPTEETVLAIFRTVLDRTDFGVADNFFDLGGHSLMAARLIAGLRTASGVDVPLRELFARPTVAGLAEAVDALRWVHRSNGPITSNTTREEIVL